MPPELLKATPTKLRQLGVDERWLQDRIDEDPTLLGLGDLQIVRREKSQPTGGRIDFLMYDPDHERRYEVEVMLGSLDESHIIRTIEYWDVERQRYPSYDHRAVIVAEEITARFFNVIRLLNRAVPMIALQLNAFTFGEGVVLHFTKVLDVFEEADEEDSGGELVDRHYWENRTAGGSLAVLDQVVDMVDKEIAPARVTYNKNHVALGTSGYNFCWFHPGKSTPHCHLRIRTGAEDRETIIGQLEDEGVSSTAFRGEQITIKMSQRFLRESRDAVLRAFRFCEVRSRGVQEQQLIDAAGIGAD
jgi:hypothetical protein